LHEALLGFCIGFIFASALWISISGIEINIENPLKKILTRTKRRKSKTYYKKEKPL